MLRIALALLCAVANAATVGQEIKMPDASTGMIDGKAEVLFWPAMAPATDGAPGPLLPITGCTVHATAYSDPDAQWTYPCGEWFLPPAGRYLMWMEQGDTIAAAQIPTTIAGKGAPLRSILPMVPAGYIGLAANVTLPRDACARFISLARRYRSFTQSISASRAQSVVRLPEGRIAGGIFDRKSGDAIALFPSVEIKKGQSIRVAPQRPASDRSDVIVVLKSPLGPREELKLALKTADRLIPPDDVVDGGQGTYAVVAFGKTGSGDARSFSRRSHIQWRASRAHRWRRDDTP